MYLKNKGVGKRRAFLIGGTIRKDMEGKNGKRVQGPGSSLVFLKCKKGAGSVGAKGGNTGKQH